MRSGLDRLRHAVLFELVALALVTPTASAIIGRELDQTAIFAVGMCFAAMTWNGIFNWMFDVMLVRSGRPLQPRGFCMRAVHAVAFEAGLFTVAVPFAMYSLDMGLRESLMTEVGLVSFYLVFAYLYNWTYDMVFPMPLLATHGVELEQ